MSETVTSAPLNDVVYQLPLASLAQAFTYDGTIVETITVEYQSVTFVQTFTNNGTNITSISQWIPQP